MYAQVISSPTNTKQIEDCHGTIVQFMKTKLKMRYPPEMVEVHRMGIASKDGTRPMVAKLANPRDKALVFHHVKNLKGVKKITKALFTLYLTSCPRLWQNSNDRDN